MNTHLQKAVAGTVAVTGIAIGSMSSWGTAVAHASTHQLTLQLSCTVPGAGSGPSTGELSWSFPDAVPAGEPTPPTGITLTMQEPSSSTEGAYSYEGIHSISGNGDAPVTVSAPQGDTRFTLPYSFNTQVPASGPLTVVIPVTMPSFTPARPGAAKITVGTITVHEAARDANGNVMPNGTVTATCTPDPALMQSFQINPAAPPSTRPAAPPPAPGPTRSLQSSPQPPSSSPSPADTGPGTLPPSAGPTSAPAPAPTPHLLAGLTGNEAAVVGGTALASAGIASLVTALLVTRRRR